jgi:hypothetical protein
MDLDKLTRWRWPLAAVLLVIAIVVFWPPGGVERLTTTSPPPSIGVGEVGGVVATPSPSTAPATPIPTVTPNASPTPAATPQPPDTGFTAEVLACGSISGDECNDRLGRLPARAATFTALVRFSDARAGDQLSTVLTGPAGTIAGFPYTLQGGGDGYYYSQFQAANLPAGDYTLTATRNGEEVATTTFSKRGG